MTREDFAARLRELRINAGITQERAAAHAGIHRVSWQRYENGSSIPQTTRLDAIARAVDAPIGAIYRRDVAAELTLSPETRASLLADPSLAHDLAARLAPLILAAAHAQAPQQANHRHGKQAAPLQVAERLLASRRASVAIAERQVAELRRAQAVE